MRGVLPYFPFYSQVLKAIYFETYFDYLIKGARIRTEQQGRWRHGDGVVYEFRCVLRRTGRSTDPQVGGVEG